MLQERGDVCETCCLARVQQNRKLIKREQKTYPCKIFFVLLYSMVSLKIDLILQIVQCYNKINCLKFYSSLSEGKLVQKIGLDDFTILRNLDARRQSWSERARNSNRHSCIAC